MKMIGHAEAGWLQHLRSEESTLTKPRAWQLLAQRGSAQHSAHSSFDRHFQLAGGVGQAPALLPQEGKRGLRGIWVVWQRHYIHSVLQLNHIREETREEVLLFWTWANCRKLE